MTREDLPKSSESFSWIWIPGWFITMLGIFGNATVIYLIATNRRLRKQVNFLIVSLAVVDFLFSLMNFPSYFICEFYLPCDRQLREIFATYFAFLSLTNLCAVTVDRYVAIVVPFKYVSFVKARGVMTIVICSWLLPTVFYFLVAISLANTASKEVVTTFNILRVFVFQLMPCFSSLLATTRVFYIAHKHPRKMSRQRTQLQFNHSISTLRPKGGLEISSARLVAVVVCVMVICYITDSYFDLRSYFNSSYLPAYETN
ncbi:trace amine-associated receptor 4-like [Stylophora pistillata]|uniref:trace amine-associated receptor 4-like n=1 Tax=Stylophora pistillata TaxID=50429 RepID=UPI000C0557AC|nr:trace amine-associated receptor 4-like [Stylophora pistillata]